MLVGDLFTVLIQGRVAASFRRGERTSSELLSLMAGGEQMEDIAGELSSSTCTGGSKAHGGGACTP